MLEKAYLAGLAGTLGERILREKHMYGLDDEAWTALQAYAAEHGRYWKSKLRELWMTGQDSGPLRRVRNIVGPSGLDRVRLPRS